MDEEQAHNMHTKTPSCKSEVNGVVLRAIATTIQHESTNQLVEVQVVCLMSSPG